MSLELVDRDRERSRVTASRLLRCHLEARTDEQDGVGTLAGGQAGRLETRAEVAHHERLGAADSRQSHRRGKRDLHARGTARGRHLKLSRGEPGTRQDDAARSASAARGAGKDVDAHGPGTRAGANLPEIEVLRLLDREAVDDPRARGDRRAGFRLRTDVRQLLPLRGPQTEQQAERGERDTRAPSGEGRRTSQRAQKNDTIMRKVPEYVPEDWLAPTFRVAPTPIGIDALFGRLPVVGGVFWNPLTVMLFAPDEIVTVVGSWIVYCMEGGPDRPLVSV